MASKAITAPKNKAHELTFFEKLGNRFSNFRKRFEDGSLGTKLAHFIFGAGNFYHKQYVKGAIFEGIVEPCGVDTQVKNAAGIRHMSARYMLTGKDKAGQDAHIYVENNGWFDENTGKMTMPFHTVPTFYTDSKELAPYLHRAQFVGEGHTLEDGLHILFFEIEH